MDFICRSEFWKQIPASEPYRVILGDVRDKLYQTRERSRQLLAHGISDIPEEAVFTNVENVNLFRPVTSHIFVILFFFIFFTNLQIKNKK